MEDIDIEHISIIYGLYTCTLHYRNDNVIIKYNLSQSYKVDKVFINLSNYNSSGKALVTVRAWLLSVKVSTPVLEFSIPF